VGCKSFGVNQVLIGLYRIGITGFAEALKKADESGLSGRDEILDLLVKSLAADNLIPHKQIEAYRTALWREYLRYKGQDFSDFLSEVDVVIRGLAGEELDDFVQTTISVFAEFELKPVIRTEPPGSYDPDPCLAVGNEIIVRGQCSRAAFKDAVRKSLSDW